MPIEIWVVLIPAVGSILVAGIALLRQVLTDRSKHDTQRTERRINANEDLFSEYRKMLAVKNTELKRLTARVRDLEAEAKKGKA